MSDLMTLALARDLIRETLSIAEAARSKPLSICVVDTGGAIVALERQDGCGIARPQLSHSKAASCVELNMPTRILSDLFENDPALHAEIKSITGRDLCPLLGGVLVKNQYGTMIGAIGVSGGDLEQEEGFVIKAIELCGFSPNPSVSERSNAA